MIGETSKNTKGSWCFKCQDYGHVVARCPSRNFLVKEVDVEIETVVYEPTGSVTDSDDDDARVSSIKLRVDTCSCIVVIDEDECRSSVFHTYITHEGKNYKLMVDGDNCANIIVKKALEK